MQIRAYENNLTRRGELIRSVQRDLRWSQPNSTPPNVLLRHRTAYYFPKHFIACHAIFYSSPIIRLYDAEYWGSPKRISGRALSWKRLYVPANFSTTSISVNDQYPTNANMGNYGNGVNDGANTGFMASATLCRDKVTDHPKARPTIEVKWGVPNIDGVCPLNIPARFGTLTLSGMGVQHRVAAIRSSRARQVHLHCLTGSTVSRKLNQLGTPTA